MCVCVCVPVVVVGQEQCMVVRMANEMMVVVVAVDSVDNLPVVVAVAPVLVVLDYRMVVAK